MLGGLSKTIVQSARHFLNGVAEILEKDSVRGGDVKL
jgi:hypothetical protein